MKQTILDEAGRLECRDLLILDAIPQKKLINATAAYPIDVRDTVVVLIDATVMGSAKQGVALGLQGIYWRNSWTTSTDRNFLSWAEVKACVSSMRAERYDLILRPGCAVNLAATNVTPAMLMVLLQRIVSAAMSSDTPDQRPNAQLARVPDAPDVVRSDSEPSTPTPEAARGAVPAAADRPLLADFSQPVGQQRCMVSLRLVGFLAEQFRFTDRVHLAPAIAPRLVSKVVEATQGKLRPDSIIVVIDNSFLRNLSSFVAVSDQGWVLSKETVTDLDVVAFSRIHEVGRHGRSLLINYGELQDLDELRESEVEALSQFLQVLLPTMEKLDIPRLANEPPPRFAIPEEFSSLYKRAFDQAARSLLEDCGDDLDAARRVVILLYALYQVMGLIAREFDAPIKRRRAGPYLLHTLLFAFVGASGLAMHRIAAPWISPDELALYVASCLSVVEQVRALGELEGHAFTQSSQYYIEALDHAMSTDDEDDAIRALRLPPDCPLHDLDAALVAQSVQPEVLDIMHRYF